MSDFLIIEGRRIPVYDPHTGEKNPYLKELITGLFNKDKFAVIVDNEFDVPVCNPFTGKINPYFERYY